MATNKNESETRKVQMLSMRIYLYADTTMVVAINNFKIKEDQYV